MAFFVLKFIVLGAYLNDLREGCSSSITYRDDESSKRVKQSYLCQINIDKEIIKIHNEY